MNVSATTLRVPQGDSGIDLTYVRKRSELKITALTVMKHLMGIRFKWLSLVFLYFKDEYNF
ncbi:hypothetical protein GCM10027037_14800 [Mucilaginibacter koreensis]